ncbi:MAG: aminopeptidase [Actinomycetota bacterium]|nr:aminopeptidase [Actinomycetota bacterium]
MADSRVDRLAAVLVDYSTAVKPGDLVAIESTPLAAPLVRAVHERVLAAGGHPDVRIAIDGPSEALLKEGNDAQLEWVSPARLEEIELADVRMYLESDLNTRTLCGVDPARQVIASRARQRIGDRVLERAANGDLRWTVTLFPTNASAQDAEMSLAEYEDFVYQAALVDREDPVGEWRSFGERLGRIAEWLGGKGEIRIVAEGTDLTLGVEGRTWVPSNGKENLPDGEVFTGPLETEVEGEIAITFPAAFQGRLVEGIRLRFEGGEVVEASARKGQPFLEEMLAMDAGARRAGEFAFGLNESIQNYTLNTLFDEKMGGTVHLALGRSYPETGGVNVSALHWDLVCDLRAGSEVYADGEVVYRDGRFLDGVA